VRAARDLLRAALGPGPVTPPPPQAELRRRRVVTIACLIVGAAVLGVSLRIEPGSAWFYPATFALAAVWTVGAFASGPLRLGRIRDAGERRGDRPVLPALGLGAALVGLFVLGALVVRRLPWLEQQVSSVADFAVNADGAEVAVLVVVTAVNGVAEELFFRGALYAAVPRHPILWTTLAYTAATLATGNLMLAFAAAVLGVVVGLERRASGGVLAPILTHCTWSLAMLLVLPVLFG
jgi:membrane protease YdiL (CAAX protease family)